MKRYFIAAALFLAFGGASFADTVAWDVTQTHNFGKLDLTTGQFNQISNFGFTPAGIGEIGNRTLYTTDAGGSTLFSIDQTTGALTAIGNTGSNITYYTFGSTSTGLYMVDTQGGLWTINATTGAATLVGSTQLNMGMSQYVGLSAGGDVLYIALGSNIYTINTANGLASFIGTSGTTDFGALITTGGTVYASTLVAPNSIYTFNPTDGTSTFSTLVAGDYSFGLAPVVPEPSSFALLGLAGSLLGAYAWKRKRNV